MGKNDSGEIPRRGLGRTGARVSALALGGYRLKTSKQFDGEPGRKQHKFPSLEELAL